MAGDIKARMAVVPAAEEAGAPDKGRVAVGAGAAVGAKSGGCC